MNILVFGAGGVGSIVGGFLARSGHSVTLLGRAWHLDPIEKKGLEITGIWGDYRIKAFDLCRSVEEARRLGVPYDLIILSVKSYDTAEAAAQAASLLAPRSMVLALQNGLGNMEKLLERIPAEKLLLGRVIFGATLEPGAVKVTVIADPVAVGAVPGAQPLLSAERMAYNLSLAKIPCVAVPDIRTCLWAKAVYNCALNGICAVGRMPYGEILKGEATRAWMEEVVRECYRVASGLGVTMDPADADAYLRLLVGRLIPSTAAHQPSMLQDLLRGRRTEIDALNGAICRYGRQLGIDTPANARVCEELQRSAGLA